MSRDEDFPRWAQEQADLLRARRFNDLDLEGLIEEIENLQRVEEQRLINLLARYAMSSGADQRAVERKVLYLLKESPSLQLLLFHADITERVNDEAYFLIERDFPESLPASVIAAISTFKELTNKLTGAFNEKI